MKKIGLVLLILIWSVTTVNAGNKFTRAKQQRKAVAQENNVHDKGYERGMKQLKDARKRHSKAAKDHKDRMDKKRKSRGSK